MLFDVGVAIIVFWSLSGQNVICLQTGHRIAGKPTCTDRRTIQHEIKVHRSVRKKVTVEPLCIGSYAKEVAVFYLSELFGDMGDFEHSHFLYQAMSVKRLM